MLVSSIKDKMVEKSISPKSLDALFSVLEDKDYSARELFRSHPGRR